EKAVRYVTKQVQYLLLEESNVVTLNSPITLVGDVHGQIYDVLELFRVGGFAPSTNYLFLGDYVDRGNASVEVISLLSCLKLKYPNRVTLLRGNHETRQITQVYGFYLECQRKYAEHPVGNVSSCAGDNTGGSTTANDTNPYSVHRKTSTGSLTSNPSKDDTSKQIGTNVWSYFTEMFDYLPITAVIDNTFFATHGGLSPSILNLDQIRVLDRFSEIPHDGPLADLLWSDPDQDKVGFNVSPRGAGYIFGPDVAERFLHWNGLQHIVRAHQLCMQGHQVLFEEKLSTVWSAPNYCYRFGNTASVLEIGDNSNSCSSLEQNYMQRTTTINSITNRMFFNVFTACPHPGIAVGNTTVDANVFEQQKLAMNGGIAAGGAAAVNGSSVGGSIGGFWKNGTRIDFEEQFAAPAVRKDASVLRTDEDADDDAYDDLHDKHYKNKSEINHEYEFWRKKKIEALEANRDCWFSSVRINQQQKMRKEQEAVAAEQRRTSKAKSAGAGGGGTASTNSAVGGASTTGGSSSIISCSSSSTSGPGETKYHSHIPGSCSSSSSGVAPSTTLTRSSSKDGAGSKYHSHNGGAVGPVEGVGAGAGKTSSAGGSTSSSGSTSVATTSSTRSNTPEEQDGDEVQLLKELRRKGSKKKATRHIRTDDPEDPVLDDIFDSKNEMEENPEDPEDDEIRIIDSTTGVFNRKSKKLSSTSSQTVKRNKDHDKASTSGEDYMDESTTKTGGLWAGILSELHLDGEGKNLQRDQNIKAQSCHDEDDAILHEEEDEDDHHLKSPPILTNHDDDGEVEDDDDEEDPNGFKLNRTAFDQGLVGRGVVYAENENATTSGVCVNKNHVVPIFAQNIKSRIKRSRSKDRLGPVKDAGRHAFSAFLSDSSGSGSGSSSSESSSEEEPDEARHQVRDHVPTSGSQRRAEKVKKLVTTIRKNAQQRSQVGSLDVLDQTSCGAPAPSSETSEETSSESSSCTSASSEEDEIFRLRTRTSSTSGNRSSAMLSKSMSSSYSSAYNLNHRDRGGGITVEKTTPSRQILHRDDVADEDDDKDNTSNTTPSNSSTTITSTSMKPSKKKDSANGSKVFVKLKPPLPAFPQRLFEEDAVKTIIDEIVDEEQQKVLEEKKQIALVEKSSDEDAGEQVEAEGGTATEAVKKVAKKIELDEISHAPRPGNAKDYEDDETGDTEDTKKMEELERERAAIQQKVLEVERQIRAREQEILNLYQDDDDQGSDRLSPRILGGEFEEQDDVDERDQHEEEVYDVTGEFFAEDISPVEQDPDELPHASDDSEEDEEQPPKVVKYV
ncbi:unnamed protein product, partial [Amoebophrya sp. A120]